MAQKPASDARQADFFGVPAPAPPPTPDKPAPRPARPDKPSQKIETPPPSRNGYVRPEPDSLDTLAARLSPAELNEFVTALPDQALAHLVIATIRQLRRRLTRRSGQPGKGGASSPLERAARQLIAELGEQGSDDDF